jgi:hypothetical protein
MTKRLVSAAASAAAIGAAALALAPSAMAAQGGICQLAGTANFGSGIPQSPTPGPFSYSFTGDLTNCNSSVSGAPSSGKIAVGVGGLPLATASGNCGTSTTSGTAVVTWSTGTTTVEKYSTTGVTGAVVIQGSVIQSITYTNSNGQSVTVSTNEPSTPVGESTGGAVTFQPPNPQGCATGAPVTTAGISGVIGEGQQ